MYEARKRIWYETIVGVREKKTKHTDKPEDQ
jgi:hypothetical protein